MAMAVCVSVALLPSCSARFLSSSEDLEDEGHLKDMGQQEEDGDLALQQLPEQPVSGWESGLPFYVPDAAWEGKTVSASRRVSVVV